MCVPAVMVGWKETVDLEDGVPVASPVLVRVDALSPRQSVWIMCSGFVKSGGVPGGTLIVWRV